MVKSVGRPVSVVSSECFPRFCAGAPHGERNAENPTVAAGASALALQQHSANPDGHEKCSYSDPRARSCPAGARGRKVGRGAAPSPSGHPPDGAPQATSKFSVERCADRKGWKRYW